MPNINETVFAGTRQHLRKYKCSQNEVERFLLHDGDFLRRKTQAISTIENIMEAHGKKELIGQLYELAYTEYGIRELQPQFRDHIVHALLSFLLGIYLNENFLGIEGSPANVFQWELAALFHDVGYPVEIAGNVITSFADKINEIRRNYGDAGSHISFRIIPSLLQDLRNDVKSLDLIQERLDEWGLNIDARKAYDENTYANKIDHGILSALSTLCLVDLLYQKHNPERKYEDICIPGTDVSVNQSFFEEDIVSACAAVYIHNLSFEYFAEARIDREKTPIAFLMRLSDCLQVWERPSKTNPKGFSPSNFNIGIRGGKLVFRANIPEGKDLQDIRTTIDSILNAPDILLNPTE